MSAATKRPFIVFAFETTHDALEAESALKRQGVYVDPIPAPADISANCGIALRLEPAVEGEAESILQETGIGVSARLRIWDV